MCIDDHFRKEVFCLKKDFPRMSCQDVVFFGNIYGEPCRGKCNFFFFFGLERNNLNNAAIFFLMVE